ncbi:hypothetical protein HELRODRAFT_171234 [Helobdella robusta]|uniref:DM14 domain-containing protein n=1 Tax=Helobdella robusta TaxID=6412 RepID=T1F3Z1_HELRO|nr:hypothetical protein HELRODRAFT_171234 [Helobdella robusta]ESO05586.1 hypothetical protein HELRODRAFT_171234 [Helobdella robusta]
MFGRKKNPAPSRKSDGGKALMAQMGFVMDVDDMVLGSPDGNDDDLEAELRALEAENEREHKSRSIKKQQNEPSKIKSAGELEKMIALSMRDLPNEDEDIEVSDTEDPDILMLEERHNNYREGIEASKQAGDQLKTRRLERDPGRFSEKCEIRKPPLPQPQLPSVLPRTSLPPPPLKSPNMNSPISYKEFLNLTDDKKQLILAEQCEAFKQEALKLKKEGMKEQAVHCIKTSKQFESVALALKDGKPVDFSGMPAFISSFSSTSPMLPAHNGDYFLINFQIVSTCFCVDMAMHALVVLHLTVVVVKLLSLKCVRDVVCVEFECVNRANTVFIQARNLSLNGDKRTAYLNSV